MRTKCSLRVPPISQLLNFTVFVAVMFVVIGYGHSSSGHYCVKCGFYHHTEATTFFDYPLASSTVDRASLYTQLYRRGVNSHCRHVWHGAGSTKMVGVGGILGFRVGCSDIPKCVRSHYTDSRLLRLKGRSREEVAAGLKGYQYQDGTLKP